MTQVFLGLGSNLGDRGANIQKALVDLERWGVKILRSSSLYVTEPVGNADQPEFYNMAVKAETEKSVHDLLLAIHSIERGLGRERRSGRKKWGPRTIDIDILLYGDAVIDEPGLVVPHPRLSERRFVLVPLVEIASGTVHPVLKKTVKELLMECSDTAIVRPL